MISIRNNIIFNCNADICMYMATVAENLKGLLCVKIAGT